MNETTWRILLEAEMEQYGDSIEKASFVGSHPDWLNIPFFEFDSDDSAPSFTLWTENRVYFPMLYDSFKSVGSVSRNPDGKPTDPLNGA